MAARSSTHCFSESVDPIARPTATCAFPPPAGTANTRSRRAPSVSSIWRAAHSHDSMSTACSTITAHSSVVQKRGRGAPFATSKRAGWLCAHAEATATIADSHPTRCRRWPERLWAGATSATYQTSRDRPRPSVVYNAGRGSTQHRKDRRLLDPRGGGVRRRIAPAHQQRHRVQPRKGAGDGQRRGQAHRRQRAVGIEEGGGRRGVVRRHVGAGRFAEAYALLAAPYRNAVPLAAFAKACRASPILVAARSVTLNRLRQQSAGTAATVEASGVLDSVAGAVPIGFVMLPEAEGFRYPGRVARERSRAPGRRAALRPAASASVQQSAPMPPIGPPAACPCPSVCARWAR